MFLKKFFIFNVFKILIFFKKSFNNLKKKKKFYIIIKKNLFKNYI